MNEAQAIAAAQLRAIRNSLEAAAIAVDTALAALHATPAAEPPGEDEPGIVTAVECRHPDMQDASVMGVDTPQRSYCKACRHYVYEDGRTERVDD